MIMNLAFHLGMRAIGVYLIYFVFLEKLIVILIVVFLLQIDEFFQASIIGQCHLDIFFVVGDAFQVRLVDH